jgi:uncharacterized protein with beta-barrel porin domain
MVTEWAVRQRAAHFFCAARRRRPDSPNDEARPCGAAGAAANQDAEVAAARPVSAALAGAPTVPFTTYGASPQRDGAVVGVSVNTVVADATNLYLRYEGDFSGLDSTHALTAGVRITW